MTSSNINNQMRIAILASGRSYHATRWANGLSARGMAVGFFTIHPIMRPLNEGVEVFKFGSGKKKDYILCVGQVKEAFRSWAPDLLHCHYATGYGILGKLTGFGRRIVSLYGADVFDYPKKSFLHKKLLRYILSDVEEMLSTSHVMANEFQNTYPDIKRPIVTPFGVDLDAFSPFVKTVTDKDTYHVGIVKKLERKYGVDVLINAIAILVKQNRDIDWMLNIVGDGSEFSALKKQVADLGLQENVNFLGAIKNNEVPNFLTKQDVFVVPSREESESFGVAAVEAQACGLPVVASNVGGLPEVVCDGETGLIVPKEDKQALAQAIEKICLNEEIKYKYSMAARERAVRKYDWSKNLDQMIEIYTRVLERTK